MILGRLWRMRLSRLSRLFGCLVRCLSLETTRLQRALQTLLMVSILKLLSKGPSGLAPKCPAVCTCTRLDQPSYLAPNFRLFDWEKLKRERERWWWWNMMKCYLTIGTHFDLVSIWCLLLQMFEAHWLHTLKTRTMCNRVAVLAMLRREEAWHTSSVVQDKRMWLQGCSNRSRIQHHSSQKWRQFHLFAEGSVLLESLEASGVQKQRRHGSKPIHLGKLLYNDLTATSL